MYMHPAFALGRILLGVAFTAAHMLRMEFNEALHYAATNYINSFIIFLEMLLTLFT